MRSVRLRRGLPPVTQSRDVIKESRRWIWKAWTMRNRHGVAMASCQPLWQLPTAMASCKYFVRRGRGHSWAPAFFRHGESTLLAAPNSLNYTQPQPSTAMTRPSKKTIISRQAKAIHKRRRLSGRGSSLMRLTTVFFCSGSPPLRV
jgi:hypothetical protein